MREVTKTRTMGKDSQKETIDDEGRGPFVQDVLHQGEQSGSVRYRIVLLRAVHTERRGVLTT